MKPGAWSRAPGFPVPAAKEVGGATLLRMAGLKTWLSFPAGCGVAEA
jgi:hypothetical protein